MLDLTKNSSRENTFQQRRFDEAISRDGSFHSLLYHYLNVEKRRPGRAAALEKPGLGRERRRQRRPSSRGTSLLHQFMARVRPLRCTWDELFSRRWQDFCCKDLWSCPLTSTPILRNCLIMLILSTNCLTVCGQPAITALAREDAPCAVATASLSPVASRRTFACGVLLALCCWFRVQRMWAH